MNDICEKDEMPNGLWHLCHYVFKNTTKDSRLRKWLTFEFLFHASPNLYAEHVECFPHEMLIEMLTMRADLDPTEDGLGDKDMDNYKVPEN